jgi:hypothetical protein
LLASVLGLGSERHVQACDKVLRGWWVVAGRRKARREFTQSVISAEVSADLCQAGLLGLMLVVSAKRKRWMSTNETHRDALLSGG